MNQWRAIITAAGLISAAGIARACYDPILSTNTSPEVIKSRYREIKAASGSNMTHRTIGARDQNERGAGMLFTPKEECFLYGNLLSQYEIPCLAPLIHSYDRLPKHRFQVRTLRDGKPLNVSVQIVGTGTNNTVLICIPGVLSDSTVFRFLVGALATEYEFWLVDPPGCGESDAPNPKELGPGGYSPAALADRELQALEEFSRQSPSSVRMLVVAHSLGGMVALRAFSDPELRARYNNVLSRIEGLVLLAPGDVFMSQVSPTLVKQAELSGLSIGVGNGLGVVREAVAEYLAGTFYASHCLPREEVDRAVAVLSKPGTRNAFKAMLRTALPLDPRTQRPMFVRMVAEEEWYRNIDLPCEIIWGKCDQTLPVHVGYMLEHQIPDARLTVIPGCKHALFLECPNQCAQAIREADHQIASRALPPQNLATKLP